jgi:hypothetical protein
VQHVQLDTGRRDDVALGQPLLPQPVRRIERAHVGAHQSAKRAAPSLWSRWPWVSSTTSTGPHAATSARCCSCSGPGSTTTQRSLPGARSTQVLVPSSVIGPGVRGQHHRRRSGVTARTVIGRVPVVAGQQEGDRVVVADHQLRAAPADRARARHARRRRRARRGPQDRGRGRQHPQALGERVGRAAPRAAGGLPADVAADLAGRDRGDEEAGVEARGLDLRG